MMTSITSTVQRLQQMLGPVEEHHKQVVLLCMRAQKKLTSKIRGEGDEKSTDLATSGKGGVEDVPLP